MTEAAIRAALSALALERGTGKTFCPSEAARRVSGAWRGLMPEVRRVACAMQREGALQGFQKGEPIDLTTARGAVRLGLRRE